MFGGDDHFVGITDLIVRLDSKWGPGDEVVQPWTWTMVGRLKLARSGHSVIEVNGEFLVVGGLHDKKTERCTLVKGKVTCVAQEPMLYDYMMWPELFLVESDFCSTQ